MATKSDFAKWQKQIEILANHFELDVITNTRIFVRYKELVKSNPRIDFPNGVQFHLWVEHNHYYALLAAIRKIFLIKDKNEISLLKIINELTNSGNIVTRQNYASHVGVVENDMITRAVVSSACVGFFDKKGKIDLSKLAVDENFLQTSVKTLAKFINQKVLHIQKNVTTQAFSDKDLEVIIEKLGVMLKEYRLFLTGSSVSWCEEDSDWDGIFKEPWIA